MKTPSKLRAALQDLVHWATTGGASKRGDAQPAIPLLLGKSWGGNLAMAVAGMPESPVQRLAVVAPAGASRRHVLCETALFWNKDDPSFGKSALVRTLLEKEVLFFSNVTGGHRVIPEFTPPIVIFAQRPSPDAAAAPSASVEAIGSFGAGAEAAVAEATKGFSAGTEAAAPPQAAVSVGAGIEVAAPPQEAPSRGADASAAGYRQRPAAPAGGYAGPQREVENKKPRGWASWLWSLALIPAFGGPALFIALMPARRGFVRMEESNRLERSGRGAAAPEASVEWGAAPEPKVVGVAE